MPLLQLLIQQAFNVSCADMSLQAHVVTPRADSASSIFAMETQLAEGDMTHAGADESSLQADLEAVRSLVEEAKQRLEAQARLKVCQMLMTHDAYLLALWPASTSAYIDTQHKS